VSEPGREPSREPTFLELLASNARLVGWGLAAVGGAWLLWRGLVWLLPDAAWLRGRG